ncbi:MAG: hypothetical protein ABJA80_04005 [bacterium]
MAITACGTDGNLLRSLRTSLADFTADAPVLVGTSITRRPDAISFDYLTAHTVGPIGVGDPSDGIVSWVWKARATATAVYLARENATRDGWLAETLLFNYAGTAIDEMDFCFDQNGQPVVVAELGGHVWIYYNDITLGGYGFRDFGVGRCARVLLDDPLDVVGSDVLVFYVDASGIVYRQQRERYGTVRATVALAGVTIADLYLEDAVRTPDGRVSILYAVRDEPTFSYAFGRIDTVLYPYHAPFEGEAMVETLASRSGALLNIVLPYVPAYDGEGMTEGFGLTPEGTAVLLNVGSPIIDLPEPYVDEAMIESLLVPSGILFLVVHDLAQPYVDEAMTQGVASQFGVLTQVVYDLAEPYASEGMTEGFGVTPTGSSLL